MRRFLRENALSMAFGTIFLAALVGQALAGWAAFNNEQLGQNLSQVSLGHYVTSSSFAADVAENWQSEYLQFSLYILATVWLVQRGSTESKTPDQAGLGSDEEQLTGGFARADSPTWARVGGGRTAVFSWSLSLMMLAIFLGSWFVQSVAGWSAYNEQQMQQMQDPLGYAAYLLNSDFWSRTLQNWQSEFLAVGSMAVLSVYLRQRGSPQSKPVGASHATTGDET